MKRLLPFLLLLASSAAVAEAGAYRVEVIIFRNLLLAAEPAEVEELRSYSQFPALANNSIPGNPLDVLPDDLPDDLHVITQKSTRMDDVWRRLRSSKAYRPLLYAAWEQNRTDYYPPMRIHDELVIDTQLRSPTNIMIADLTADDPLADYRSIFYRLDGALQLRRSRFLHLFLDMEYREVTPETSSRSTLFGATSAADEQQDKVNHKVFTLKQNRQIRSSQMQYFDTPFLGALVFVSAVTGG